MALIEIGTGRVNFSTGQQFMTQPVDLQKESSYLFVVESLNPEFVRRYEYLILVPIIKTSVGEFRSAQSFRYYLQGQPMGFVVNTFPGDIGEILEVSILVIPKSVYTGGNFELDLPIKLSYDDTPGTAAADASPGNSGNAPGQQKRK